MGPPEKQPPLPEWEFAMVPAEPQLHVEAAAGMQLAAGDGRRHRFQPRLVPALAASSNSDPLFKGSKGNQYNMGDMKPVFEVVESPGGLYIGARRNAENGNYYWRDHASGCMPSFTMIPPRGDHPVHGHFWVPIDDENCWAWSFDYQAYAPADRQGAQGDARTARASTSRYVPGTYIPAANKNNDYLMDRAAQKAGRTFSGVVGIAMQDASLAGKHGADRRPHQGEPGLDRQRHHHGAAPAAARAEGAGEGRDAARHRSPTHQHVRSAAVVLPPDKHFKDAAKDALVVQTGKAARDGLTHADPKAPACRAPPRRATASTRRTPSRARSR